MTSLAADHPPWRSPPKNMDEKCLGYLPQIVVVPRLDEIDPQRLKTNLVYTNTKFSAILNGPDAGALLHNLGQKPPFSTIVCVIDMLTYWLCDKR